MLLQEIGKKYLEYLILTKGTDALSISNLAMYRMAFGASIIIILLTILALLISILLVIVLINQIKLKKMLKKLTDKDTRTEE